MASKVADALRSTVGVVVIGRNEGERLKGCFESLAGVVGRIVYVDSGSSDGSVGMALAMGVDVVELDSRMPFTAARARNQGFRRLRDVAPDLVFVQFVDGDCEVVSGWIGKAATWLEKRPDVAVVCGRRRERYPGRSIYNMLCDLEWDTPVGVTKACGGDALMRIDAVAAVNGYRGDLIAGEEPELCVRLRAAGWQIWRLDEEMTLHDVAISSFGQWWKRTLRAGYAYAQGADLHGASPEWHCVREVRAARRWALWIPLGVLGAANWWGAWAAGLLLIYPFQMFRVASQGARSARENWWRAAFIVLGMFPEFCGQVMFLYHRHLRRQPHLIEYK